MFVLFAILCRLSNTTVLAHMLMCLGFKQDRRWLYIVLHNRRSRLLSPRRQYRLCGFAPPLQKTIQIFWHGVFRCIFSDICCSLEFQTIKSCRPKNLVWIFQKVNRRPLWNRYKKCFVFNSWIYHRLPLRQNSMHEISFHMRSLTCWRQVRNCR